jgi:predicted dehydrogenase
MTKTQFKNLKKNSKLQENINVGIIGLGGAGRAHARRLNRNPHVGRVFGYDIKKVKGIENITIVNSLEELIDKVDAITVCTPDKVHIDGIIAALKKGKHVLSEKPMVASLDQAKKLRPYIKKYSHLVFGVHHQMRCTPAFWKAKKIIEKGTLGKLFYIEANYWHDMRKRAKQFDDWRQKDGQSLIFGHGCHPADLLMFLTNEVPIKHSTYVSKNSFRDYYPKYTSATSIMQFPSNLIGKIHVNSSCIYPQVYDLIIAGDKGTYVDGVLYTGNKGFEQVANFFGNGGWFDTEMIINKIGIPRKILSLLINVYMRSLNTIMKLFITVGSKMSLKIMREADFGFRKNPLTAYNHDFACQYIINNFIETIRGNEEIIANYDEAVRVIKLCEELERDGLANFKP